MKVMKRNTRITALSILLPAIFLLVLAGGCKKSSDPPASEPPVSDLWLKGSVINAQTHAPIVNAQVYFSGQSMLTTDVDGIYRVSCKAVTNGTYPVRVKAEGFGYGFATATIASDAAMVNSILLNPLATAVSIGPAGGILTVADPESYTSGGQTTLVVPQGAFTAGINVSFTRFTGVDVPGYAPANLLNLGTVNLAPAGTVASKPVELQFAMPFTDAGVTSLPLMRYDFETNNWVNTGIVANVNTTSNTASAMITTFGLYSLAVTGSFSEPGSTSGATVNQQLDPKQSYIGLTYQASIEYPGGIPATVSPAYLRNLASQNTAIGGTRTSFSDATTLGYNYIGTKPDSLAPVKSTNSSYYRWVPNVSYSPQAVSVTTIIHGTTATGIIHKQQYTASSFWQYVHDQGGGGK